MKNIKFNKNTLLVAFIFILSTKAYSQSKGTKSMDTTTVIHLASGVTHPIAQNTQQPIGKKPNPTPYTFISGETRIFPSPNPQSEIHISINKINPQVLLLSSQTFPVTNSWQGAYWSTNGGSTWIGSDNLPNNAPGRGDPSTAFDANGNGYIATMTPTPGNINGDPIGYSVQRTANNGTSWGAQVQSYRQYYI